MYLPKRKKLLLEKFKQRYSDLDHDNPDELYWKLFNHFLNAVKSVEKQTGVKVVWVKKESN